MRLRFEDCVLDLDRFELSRAGDVVPVEPKVLGLLAYMARRPGALITRDELLGEVWEGTQVSDSALSRAIKEARRAVGDDGASQSIIETVRGRGFRLAASVEEEEAVVRAGPRVVPFVGRSAAMQTLELALTDALAGRGRLASVAGPAGIGKTRLVQELGALAHARGASVHTGRALETDGASPLWPWVQLVRSLLEGRDEAAKQRLLGSGAATLAQAMPTLSEHFPGLSPPVAASRDPQQEMFLLFDALTGVVRRVATDGPVVLVLEDAHRADLTSLRMLRFAAHQLRTNRVLIVLTYRDTEVELDGARGPELGTLLELDPAGCIQLAGLDATEVRKLASAIVDEPVDAARAKELHRVTGGNPLFVHQLAPLPADPTAQETLTLGVRAAIRSHVAALPVAGREMLQVASVLGRDFDATELGHVLDRDGAAVLSLLETARRARLVVPVDGAPLHFEFVHALVRDALYEQLETAHTQTLHARTAKVIERRFASHLEPHLARIAFHHEAACAGNDVSVAIEWLMRAAASAAERIARDEAADFYERALALHDRIEGADRELRCELFVRIVETRRSGEQALLAAERAVELSRELDDLEAMARAAWALDPEYGPALHARWMALHERVLADISGEQTPLRVMLLAKIAHAYLMMPGIERARAAAEEALRLAREIGDADLLANSLGACLFAYGPEDMDRRLTIAEEIEGLTSSCNDPNSAIALGCTCYSFLESGDLERARRNVEGAVDILEPARLPMRVIGRWVAGTHAMHSGDLEVLDASLERLRELARALMPETLAGLQISRIPWWRECDRLEEVVGPLEGVHSAHLASGLALALALLGRREDAAVLLKRLGASGFAAIDRNSSWLGSMTRLAEVVFIVGHTEFAGELYEQLLPFEARIASGAGPDGGGCVARELGLLAMTLGQLDRAQTHMERAVDVNEAVGLVLWAARCRGELAGILNQRGDIAEAKRLAREALDRARAIGMPVLERTCEALL